MTKTLILDIETGPNVAHVWGLWDQNIGLSQLLEAGQMIAFSAKWHGDRKVMFYSDHHDGHASMVHEAHRLWDEADVLVHFNGDRFDLPHLRREYVLAGFNPPSPALSVDLKRVVSRQFRFPSSKLAYVTKELGLSGKLSHTGHEMWVQCLAGDDKAWSLMRRYNMQDVRTTEELYDRLLPWIPNHPNVALIDGQTDEIRCGRCASTDIQWRGWSHTQVSSYKRFQCNSCGSWGRAARRERAVEARGA